MEEAVSSYIGSLPFLWLDADDDPGPSSIRAIIERNAIGLLSHRGPHAESSDPASTRWLGQHADRSAVRESALWNVRHTEDEFDPSFLDLVEECAERTMPLER